jgi:hypothetical protein
MTPPAPGDRVIVHGRKATVFQYDEDCGLVLLNMDDGQKVVVPEVVIEKLGPDDSPR